MIFTVLDVSFAINLCINYIFLHVYLQFNYISVAVKWYRYVGTGYVVHTILGVPVAQPAPTKFGTNVVIATCSPNPSCVPYLNLLASTAEEINRGSLFFGCSPSPDPHQFWS